MQVVGSDTGSLGFTSETKFVVDAARGQEIRDWARDRLAADPHGSGAWSDEYRVSSVYFDTSARDVFHRRGSFGRSKYRIRRYREEPTAFLERKLRTGGRLAKRRTTIAVGMLPLIAGPTLNGDATAWFRRRVALRGLHPVCQVSYLRTARVSSTAEGPVRLTLDEKITAFASEAFTFESRPAIPVLAGQVILELKYGGRLPALFKELVERFALEPQRCSKYRTTAEALGLVRAPREGAPGPVNA
jgi:hypothetical protein